MSTSLQRNTLANEPRADELRPEALQVVETLHETIKSWAPESDLAVKGCAERTAHSVSEPRGYPITLTLRRFAS